MASHGIVTTVPIPEIGVSGIIGGKLTLVTTVFGPLKSWDGAQSLNKDSKDLFNLAEVVGFEPTDLFRSSVFKTVALSQAQPHFRILKHTSVTVIPVPCPIRCSGPLDALV